jgi:prepilin-type N-terminal cleavage/methylation domain-containing protein
MMTVSTKQHGITLIELMIVVAILGLVLGGVYGMLNSANQMFIRNKALVESQQTSRVVINYLTYRLRQLEGSGLSENPRDCIRCHLPDQDTDQEADDPDIPCIQDVLIPRKAIYLEILTTIPLPTLAGELGTAYQNISGGNSIRFWGDLLPSTGMADTFTDSPRYLDNDGTTANPNHNGKWDLIVDKDGDGKYDPGDDREFLYYDMNDNGLFDFYAEEWTLSLRESEQGNFYELVESLSFEKKDDAGNVIESYAGKNNSTYSAYTAVPVATGIVAMGIRTIPRMRNLTSYSRCDDNPHQLMSNSCAGTYDMNTTIVIHRSGAGQRDGCHGENALLPQPGNHASTWNPPTSDNWLNVYGNETCFSYVRFVEKHPWWNLKGFVVDLVTVDPTGQKVFRTQQFLTPRNLEVNQERTEAF